MAYTPVSFMNANLGILDSASGVCVQDGDLYDAISCPAGHYKRPRDEVAGRCAALGLPCEAGFECLCSPCFLADELDVVQGGSG